MQDKEKYFLQPGYIFVSKEPHLISTVLGSCVSVCIWDEINHFGGMNHYIHPKPFEKQRSAHFGSISIPHLINLLVKMGSKKSNLKAHIIGGAQNKEINCCIVAKQNVEIAEKILKKYHISVMINDTGGEMGRKIVFDTETGEVVVMKVHNLREYDWYDDKCFDN